MGISTTADWQRATFIWYTGGTADLNGALFDFYHDNGSNTIYVDDVEVYKLDGTKADTLYISHELIERYDNDNYPYYLDFKTMYIVNNSLYLMLFLGF